MAVFEWNQFNGYGGKISRYIQCFKCRATNIVAYFIPNKQSINMELEFNGDYEPLKNNYGVYFLLGDSNEDGDKPKIYVGQASTREETHGMDRLKEHINLNTDWYKDKWESVIYVTSTDNSWSTSLIDTLERLFIACFRNRAEYECLNSKRGKDGNIPDKDFKTELLAISDLLALPMFGYKISKDTKVDVINSVYDKLVEMATDIRDELKQELKVEYLNKYNPEDRARIEWVKRVEVYDEFKSSIELANNFIISGRILNGSKGEVVTPDFITKQMVEMLPSDVFHSGAKFLDPACKSGEYLIQIIHKLMSDDESLPINHEPKFTDKLKRLKHIVENQLYASSLSANGYSVSNHRVIEVIERYQRELTANNFTHSILNNIVILPNIIYIPGYDKAVKTDKVNLIKLLKERFVIQGEDEMKFDVVIGNPPYNSDIYIDFVVLGHRLANKYSCWITPAKWQAKGGVKNEAFRKNIVPYMTDCVYYPDCLDVFAIQESSGVCYYLIGKDKVDKCRITNLSAMKPIINSTEERSILNEETLWNIGNSIVEKIKTTGSKAYDLKEVYDEDKKLYTVNLNTQITKATGMSGCWDWENSCINQSWIGKGGVLFTQDGTVILATPKIITQSEDTSSGTSVNVFTSNDTKEVESYISWLSTKLFRFLILINIGSLTMINSRGLRFIPDPGPFDHIFTDQELYNKYGLNADEINVIESLLKSRNYTNIVSKAGSIEKNKSAVLIREAIQSILTSTGYLKETHKDSSNGREWEIEIAVRLDGDRLRVVGLVNNCHNKAIRTGINRFTYNEEHPGTLIIETYYTYEDYENKISLNSIIKGIDIRLDACMFGAAVMDEYYDKSYDGDIEDTRVNIIETKLKI